jgi:hypothetical protein
MLTKRDHGAAAVSTLPWHPTNETLALSSGNGRADSDCGMQPDDFARTRRSAAGRWFWCASLLVRPVSGVCRSMQLLRAAMQRYRS